MRGTGGSRSWKPAWRVSRKSTTSAKANDSQLGVRKRSAPKEANRQQAGRKGRAPALLRHEKKSLDWECAHTGKQDPTKFLSTGRNEKSRQNMNRLTVQSKREGKERRYGRETNLMEATRQPWFRGKGTKKTAEPKTREKTAHCIKNREERRDSTLGHAYILAVACRGNCCPAETRVGDEPWDVAERYFFTDGYW